MVGAALAVTTLIDRRLLLVVLAYQAVVVVLAAVDLTRLPGRRDFLAERSLPHPLALGADQKVAIAVQVAGGDGLRIEVADHAPLELRPSQRVLAGEIRDGGFSAAYTVRPAHRGAYQFGPIDIRWGRPRGFWQVQVRADAGETVAVYPNILAIREYELRLRRGMPLMAGLRRARPPGATTAFAGLRDYVRGDELRRISWKATARRDSPVTTVVEADRGQQMIIAIDCARLMTAPSGDLSKLDHAVNSALLLAWVAQSQGDRVGLLTFSDSVLDWLAPQRGPIQVSRINQRLYAVPGGLHRGRLRRRLRVPRRPAQPAIAGYRAHRRARPGGVPSWSGMRSGSAPATWCWWWRSPTPRCWRRGADRSTPRPGSTSGPPPRSCWRRVAAASRSSAGAGCPRARRHRR